MTKFIPLVKLNIGEPLTSREALKPDVDIDPDLLNLVRLRRTQIRPCPVGMEKPRLDLQARAKNEKRLGKLKVWRESSCFSAKEKIALALGEAISSYPTKPILDQLIEEARRHFTKEELIALLLAIMPAD